MRPRTGRRIAGVCQGFAEYFDLDVTLIRIVWLLVAILGFPVGLIGYAIAWIVMPEEPKIVAVVPAGQQAISQQ
ncbi:MAG: PspC domain-containing protein [Terriglobales bacterium]